MKGKVTRLFKKDGDETASLEKEAAPRLPSLFWALAPILAMVALMLYVFGFVADPEVYDAAHLPLLCATVVACAVGMAYGRSFKYMLDGILHRLSVSLEAILILILVGLLISSFMISGTIPALIFQAPYSAADLFSILHYGPSIVTGNEFVDVALSKGGLDNQMWTISLVILAVSFGGALERCGSIERLFAGLKRMLHKVGTLTGCTLLTSIFCDAVMCDQYLGIGIPAPLYADKYDEMGLSRSMLSRTLEDAGTMWSPLFPWTACGAYQMSVLGLNPFAYFPFAFVNLLSPIYAFITAMMGRNVFWADGAYTNLFGKTKLGKPAACPAEVREAALANLEAARAAGKAPRPSE